MAKAYYITDIRNRDNYATFVDPLILKIMDVFITKGGCDKLQFSESEIKSTSSYKILIKDGMPEDQALRIAKGHLQETNFIKSIMCGCGSLVTTGPDTPEANSKSGDFIVKGTHFDLKVSTYENLVGSIDGKSLYNFVDGYYICLNKSGTLMKIIPHSVLDRIFKVYYENGADDDIGDIYLPRSKEWVTSTKRYTIFNSAHHEFIGDTDIISNVKSGRIYQFDLSQLMPYEETAIYKSAISK